MTSALLDFPWDLTDIVNQHSAAYGVLREFDNLCSSRRLAIVPFVDHHDYNALWLLISNRRVGGNIYVRVMQFLARCMRPHFGPHRATPAPEPRALSDKWKRALREEMGDCVDWRRPHIVACEARRREWFPVAVLDEVAIECEDRPSGARHKRIIAFLGSYRDHKFLASDLDPWDVRHGALPPGPGHLNHPCYLPRPPSLGGVPLGMMLPSLAGARRHGWNIGNHYYYLPPADFDPSAIDQAAWRAGRAFPRGTSNGRTGPVDADGRVWAWDDAERHWDVQVQGGGYYKINHLGERLP